MKAFKAMLAFCFLAGYLVATQFGVYACASSAFNVLKESKVIKAQESVKDDVKIKTASIAGKTYYLNYLIDNQAQLRAIGTGEYSLSAMYMLNSDIDLSGKEWTPIGSEENPFKGVFIGNGFEIRNLTMTSPSAKLIGFFGYAEGASIHNVTLRDLNILKAGGTGKSVGPIVVFAENSKIEDNKVYPKK